MSAVERLGSYASPTIPDFLVNPGVYRNFRREAQRASLPRTAVSTVVLEHRDNEDGGSGGHSEGREGDLRRTQNNGFARPIPFELVEVPGDVGCIVSTIAEGGRLRSSGIESPLKGERGSFGEEVGVQVETEVLTRQHGWDRVGVPCHAILAAFDRQILRDDQTEDRGRLVALPGSGPCRARRRGRCPRQGRDGGQDDQTHAKVPFATALRKVQASFSQVNRRRNKTG